MSGEPQDASHDAPLVLLVEDDLPTRMLFRDYLRHEGFRVVDAHNGHQALEKARDLQPDIVVTDLAVPGMDGFAFGSALQQSSSTREIPILAVTGHTEYLDDADRLRRAGIRKVLVKPCAPDRVTHELNELLGRSIACPARPNRSDTP